MTPESFATAVATFDDICQQIDRAFGPRQRAALRQSLGKARTLCERDVMPYVQIHIGVLDREHKKIVRFGWIDVDHCDDGELFVVGHEAVPRTYVVDGKLVTVPYLQCPMCLSKWKIDPTQMEPCSTCGAKLSESLKLMVANAECPLCGADRDDASDHCSCGLEWNAEYLEWPK